MVPVLPSSFVELSLTNSRDAKMSHIALLSRSSCFSSTNRHYDRVSAVQRFKSFIEDSLRLKGWAGKLPDLE